MEDSDILKSIEGELAFYRGRLFTVYSYALLLQTLLITGKSTIPGKSPLIANIAYTMVFVMVVIFAFFFNDSYRSRIYKMRLSRTKLIEKAGYDQNIFSTPANLPQVSDQPLSLRSRLFSTSPSMQFVYLIAVISVLGIVLTWTGGIIPVKD
ncbi:MAG TPA: hypothetical protein VF571_01070 [Pyrinomonadaceae bacterium]